MISSLSSPNQLLQPISAQVNAAGHLQVGGCDVVELARQFGTPLYIVDEASLRRSCQLYRDTFAALYPAPTQVLYATKAWNCLALCALVAQEGLGVDVASGGELYTALQAQIPADRIYLHGNAKSRQELQMALEVGCTIVVNGDHELQMLAQLAQGSGARVMLRVNPGIDVHTHDYIRTGQIDSKFGIGTSELAGIFELLQLNPDLDLVGLHAHIGSQIFELRGHADLGPALAAIWQQALDFGLRPTELNVGGGLGIRYVESDDPPSIPEWVAAVVEGVSGAFGAAGLPLPKLLCEPGRSLVGPAGITAYTLGGSKRIPVSAELPQGRTFITIDGGMSDNPRPITYGARYTALLADRPEATPDQIVTVAGKHCESGDLLLKDVALPATSAGDILVVLATGAYNYSMASNYNRFPRPAAVLVGSGRAELIVQRETYADLVRQDLLPAHLRSPAAAAF